MKGIKLKKDPSGLSTRAVIMQVLTENPQGETITGVRRKVALSMKFESAPPEPYILMLQDAEWDFLKHCYTTHRFPSNHKFLLEIMDDIENYQLPEAPKAEPKPEIPPEG